MTNAITAYDMVPVEQIVYQTTQVKALINKAMQDGVHYGIIPGCGRKPTLLQPGAQKLMLMFGLADSYQIVQTDHPNGHREYQVTCTLTSKQTGQIQGNGIGLCSTMEKKYRYRNASDYEITDQPIPDDAREHKQEYRKQGFGMKKIDGVWHWVKYREGQVENPDIADTYNTVIKMACKRALIAAVLNTLAVSDTFTQDVEDFAVIEEYEQPVEVVIEDVPKQRDPRLNKLRGLMREAKDMGILVSDKADPKAGLMGWIHDTYGKEPEELDDMQLLSAEEHVQSVIDQASMSEPTYLDSDIVF